MLSSVTFDLFPAELLLQMFSDTSPETAIISRSINKLFSNLLKNHPFWIEKIKRHFPESNTENIQDGFSEFRKLYDVQYRGLSVRVRKLFSLIKESDVEGLKKANFSLDDMIDKDVNVKNFLSYALEIGNREILKEIYTVILRSFQTPKQTVDTLKIDQFGRTILWYAIRLGEKMEAVKLLLLKGSRYSEEYDKEDRKQPIHVAALAGRLDIVNLFLEIEPALIEETDAHGQTPLLWASAEGHEELVKYLLDQGANKEVSTNALGSHNDRGKTPLYWACEGGHYEVVKMLIDAGAELGVLPALEMAPIHRAAETGRLDMVKLFIEKKPALLELTDTYGQTPVLWAAAQGHKELVEYFLTKGANLHVSTNWPGQSCHGKTTVDYACRYYPVIDVLVNYCLKHYLFLTPAEKYVEEYKLPVNIKAKINLLNYVSKTAANKNKHNALFLFNDEKVIKAKLDAAYAFIAVLNGEGQNILQSHFDAINKSKNLKSIARNLGWDIQILKRIKPQ